MLNFLKSTPAKIVTLLLLVQAIAFYGSIRQENVPSNPPLAEMPKGLGSWSFVRDGVSMDQETMDDPEGRRYVSKSRYMRSKMLRRRARSIYSSRHFVRSARARLLTRLRIASLESGWTPLWSPTTTPSPLKDAPAITVNRYVIEHGNDRSVVLYWYQSRDRVVASEYKAKFWVMADALRLNRTDTALVRVVVPVIDRNEEQATQLAVDFVKSFYQPLHAITFPA